MYEVTIERWFCAAHAIIMRGEREVRHGHNWRVEVTIAGTDLDDDGLLCDFHEVQEAVDEVVAPFRNVDLNDTPPFDRINPTAELIAKYIAERVGEAMPDGIDISCVAVTEAPNCIARYRPRP